MDTVVGGDLTDRLLLPQDLLDNLGLKGGGVTFSHAHMIHLIFAPSTVQIYGSTILEPHQLDRVACTPSRHTTPFRCYWETSPKPRRRGDEQPRRRSLDISVASHRNPTTTLMQERQPLGRPHRCPSCS